MIICLHTATWFRVFLFNSENFRKKHLIHKLESNRYYHSRSGLPWKISDVEPHHSKHFKQPFFSDQLMLFFSSDRCYTHVILTIDYSINMLICIGLCKTADMQKHKYSCTEWLENDQYIYIYIYIWVCVYVLK